MKFCQLVLALALGSGAAFTPLRPAPLKRQSPLKASLLEDIKSRATAAILSGLLVMSPVLVVPPEAALAAPTATRQDASTSSGSRVNKDASSLLRLALPINSPDVRKLQEQVEGIAGDLRVKRIGAAKDGLQKSRSTIANAKITTKILAAVRPAEVEKAKAILAEMDGNLAKSLEQLEKPVGQGSLQEREVLDNAKAAQIKAAAGLTALEELMVPAGYTVTVPSEYSNLPQLQGRAEVELELKKAEPGEQFDIDGDLFEKVTLKMTIDGFNAPVTGGNFVDLVNKGFYNGMPIQRSDGFVVQTGDPEGPNDGYVPPGATKPRTIPLEIMVKADKGVPMYESTTEEDLRGKEATALPFQSYGALGMARTEDNDNRYYTYIWQLFFIPISIHRIQ